jgi:hypothetical protein
MASFIDALKSGTSVTVRAAGRGKGATMFARGFGARGTLGGKSAKPFGKAWLKADLFALTRGARPDGTECAPGITYAQLVTFPSFRHYTESMFQRALSNCSADHNLMIVQNGDAFTLITVEENEARTAPAPTAPAPTAPAPTAPAPTAPAPTAPAPTVPPTAPAPTVPPTAPAPTVPPTAPAPKNGGRK